MPEINNLVLRFSGDKAGLKKQLKEWCGKNGTNMNKKVIDLIQELIDTSKKEDNK